MTTDDVPQMNWLGARKMAASFLNVVNDLAGWSPEPWQAVDPPFLKSLDLSHRLLMPDITAIGRAAVLLNSEALVALPPMTKFASCHAAPSCSFSPSSGTFRRL
jgi:hypothetical protein